MKEFSDGAKRKNKTTTNGSSQCSERKERNDNKDNIKQQGTTRGFLAKLGTKKGCHRLSKVVTVVVKKKEKTTTRTT